MKRREFLAAASLSLAGCNSGMPAITGGFVGARFERGHVLRPHAGASAPAWLAPSRSWRTRVIIVGDGVAGLAAALALRLRGIDGFTVLELEDSAGGNSRGAEVNGIACPLGAHYLPVPGDCAGEVQDLLEELGLRQRVAGRWDYDERNLCHSPQERLFIKDQWQEGLLPLLGVDAQTLWPNTSASPVWCKASRAPAITHFRYQAGL